MPVDDVRLVAMYRALAGSRIAEEAITGLARRGVLPGHHSGLGHESVGVGVGMALRPDDCVQVSHRSGMMLAHARGGYSLREAVLSRFGRAPSWSGQIAGRPRTLAVVGLVGSGAPMAVGVAMADRIRQKDTVTVTFFGDGAANEGAVHEAMNLAGAQRLPIVFVLENNGLAISMSVTAATAARELVSRADGYGMPGWIVDGQDPVAVFDTARRAVEDARAGAGPGLIEARLLRREPHAEGLADLRGEQELAEARRRDGVRLLRDRIVHAGLLTEVELAAIEAACRAEVEGAVEEGLGAGILDECPGSYSDADAWRMAYAP
jgi:pyruvate dehydrogenase E1 component alpha subunit